MDPALQELMAEDANDEIKAILRLRSPGVVPSEVRVVAQFGEIVTCRLKRQSISEIWADDDISSLKAPRLLIPEPTLKTGEFDPVEAESHLWNDERRPAGLPETGRGVVVGVADWGFDFAHPDFLHPDGTTRLIALWDQRGWADPTDINRYGYGTIYTADKINQALKEDDPYQSLGYHPADGDPNDTGSHGTHVAGIIAGNGKGGGPLGVAPDAELVFVHLSTGDTGGLATLGDSVTLLEAMDFIIQTAGERPCVINASVGRHGAQHDGTTLVEQGLDALVLENSGRAIVQSTGNYFDRSIHAAGQLRPGDQRTLSWQINTADRTPNELEIWYSGRDVMDVDIQSPDGALIWKVPLGERATFKINGREVGRIYHRDFDPNNQDHHIDMFLDPGAPEGSWEVTLVARDIVDGRFHAWVERDASCLNCQSSFGLDDDDPFSTTGTICNGFRTIAVGAYNSHSVDQEIASFSSAGPTRDGRQKPDCVAPGVQILAPRSAPRSLINNRSMYVRKSGTSMAAPHVTGTIACMFEAASRHLTIQETRNALLSSTTPISNTLEDLTRIGSGYLNIEQAVEFARQIGETNGSVETQAVQEAVTIASSPSLGHADTVNKVINISPTEQPDGQQEMARKVSMSRDEGKHPSEEAFRDTSLLDENLIESRTRNFILISGGPGLYDDRDIEHDKSWANYVTPPLLLTDTEAKRMSFIEADEEVWWFVYKPAYVRRWEDDLKRKRSSVQQIKNKGFTSYVDMIEARARTRGWNLSWFDSATDFWRKLNTFNDPISRVLYWGHASGGLWLTLAHSVSSTPVAPDSSAIITTSDIAANAGLAKHFQPGSLSRIHRFFGCNTDQFAQIWAKTFNVWGEGYRGKVDFGDIHKTGGEPGLVGSASRKRFSMTGTEITIPESDAEIIEALEDNRYDVEDWVFNLNEATEVGHVHECLANEDVESNEVIYDSTGEQQSSYLVKAMSEAISDPLASYISSAELLYRLIAKTGPTEATNPLGGETFPSAAVIFDAITGQYPAIEHHFEQTFEVVAYPGEHIPQLLEKGDILVRRGEGNLAHLAMLPDTMTLWADELKAAGLFSEATGPGLYAHVIEAGLSPHGMDDRFSRRLSRDGNRLDQDNLILRLRPEVIGFSTEMFGEELDVAQAVRLNQVWSNRLGWAAQVDAIVQMLHTEPFTPGPEEFARLVYEWQQRNGLTADGIIGPQTWQRMQQLITVEPIMVPSTAPTSPMPTGVQAIHAATGPDLLTTTQVQLAVQHNRQLGQTLRWWPLFTPISVYYLRFRQQPSEEEFAQAVARWQQAVGGRLSVSGVIDRATWRAMRPRGEPSRFSTSGPQGTLQRPRNYSQVVEIFGNPSVQHEVWRRQSIVRISAPQGLQFQTLAGGPRNYILGHRKLKSQFETLFRAIAEAGLWNSLQPVSGPFAYRNVRGGRGLSMHAFGIALDVRPSEFPRGQNRSYPPLPLVELFRDHGFHWGIFFPKPDPHHFQFATGT
ncbi:MAG: S8 family serine peptidase [Ardenticatenaceae bacterium]|nr:S8 family serine peptidase [Ardenticatenaceae bacterium]